MKISFIRRTREQVKIRNNHMEIMLDSPLSILEMIGTVMQLCKGIPSSFSSFFNKMVSIAESIMTFVMLHNTDPKCE